MFYKEIGVLESPSFKIYTRTSCFTNLNSGPVFTKVITMQGWRQAQGQQGSHGRCAKGGCILLGGAYRGTSLIRNTPSQDPTVRICLGPMGVLGGGGVSYERGTLVALIGSICSHHIRTFSSFQINIFIASSNAKVQVPFLQGLLALLETRNLYLEARNMFWV